jgi:hypothetical protein
MKILRSVTRRGFSVGSAGYFAVLKPNTWFPATRLPVPFHYRASQSAQVPALHQEATLAPNIITLSVEPRGVVRPALVVLAAMAITSALLLWIMHP